MLVAPLPLIVEFEDLNLKPLERKSMYSASAPSAALLFAHKNGPWELYVLREESHIIHSPDAPMMFVVFFCIRNFGLNPV